MGRKRTRKKNSKKNKSVDIDLAVIFMVVVSILLFVLIYAEKGAIGEFLSPILGGIIGPIKYLIPIGFLVMAFTLTKCKEKYVTSKVIQYIILLGCIASLLSIFQISKGTLSIDDCDFSEVLEASYSLGEKSIGGGTVGTIIAYPLIKLLGMFGAAILAGGIAAALIVFTFGIRPSEIFFNISDKLDEMRSQREEELEDYRIRREERRKNRIRKEDIEETKPRRVKNQKDNEPESIIEEQITINLNNNEMITEKTKGKSIFGKHEKEETIIEDLPNPNEIESNLFKQEEEKKENKVKEVLQLEHSTIMVEDENYEYPPVELMQQSKAKGLKGGKKALTDTATKLQ